MEEEKDPSPTYIKSFNQGYTLSQYEPELLKQLLKSTDKGNEIAKAMEAGKQQFELQKLKAQVKQQSKDRER